MLDDHGLLPTSAPLTLPGPLSSVSLDVSEKFDAGSNTVVDLDPDNRHSLPDSPTISQVPDKKAPASEEGTGVNDAIQSVVTSRDETNIISNGCVVENAQEDRRQSGEIPIYTEKPESEHSFSDGFDALQERLELMEQQFAGQ